MPDPAIMRALFDRPPADAIEFLRSKGLALTWNFQEMQDDAHARAFTVAKATRLDILADIRGALVDNLAAGGTLEDFNRDLIPTLRAKGWWGKQVAVDPDTLDAELVQLGSVRRLKTIYQTNVQSAYMAGRYRRQMDAEAFPYLQYLAVMDSRTRQSHALLHGKVWRKDDPVWNSIYPPNGYNCRCRTRALTGRQLDRAGLKPEPAAEVLTREVAFGMNKVTGEVFKATQAGVKVKDALGKTKVMWVDAGFNANPGRAALWDVRGRLPDCDGGVDFADAPCLAMPNQKTWRDYGRPRLRDVAPALKLPAPEMLPAGNSRYEAVEILARALGLLALDTRRTVRTPLEPVRLDRDWLPHVVEKEDDARERYGNFVLPALRAPFEVWLTAYTDGKYRKRYIGLFEGTRDLMVVVRENLDGSLMWNLMQASHKNMDAHRIGALLYGK